MLHSANGTSIQTFGTTHLSVEACDGTLLPWRFIIANTTFSILGMDFLKFHKLVIDLPRKQLTSSHHVINCYSKTSDSTINSVSTIPHNLKPEIKQLLQKHASITTPLQYNNIVDNHHITHKIDTTCRAPIKATARPLHGMKGKIAREAFEALERQGIISQATSAWSSPLHMVPKKDKTFRCVGDYRRLNAVTVPDRYPLPLINNLADSLAGAQVFSSLDLRSAYHQVPVAVEDREKTAIVCPWGKLFVWNRMPFGLRNSASTFMRFINFVLHDIPNIFIYMDDILIYSKNKADHLKTLKKVFEQLEKYQLTINTEKCIFLKTEINFLGHTITDHGLTVSKDKVKVIADFPIPRTLRSLKRFLGMVNYYRRYIQNAAAILQPLTKFLKDTYKKKVLSKYWEQEQDQAFNKIKQILVSRIYLNYPRAEAPLIIITDVSSTAIGAVLNQIVGGELEPLAFFSQNLNEVQRKYPAFDRELLAGYKAIRHFEPYIASSVVWFTDHKPCIHALVATNPKVTMRALRHLQYISSIITKAEHISGIDNVVADTISRADCNAIFETIPAIDLSRLYEEQMADTETRKYIENNGDKVKLVAQDNNNFYINTEKHNQRPIIPTDRRQQVFKIYHGMSHPGKKATVKLITKNFFYPRMITDIASQAKACPQCQRNKITRHNLTPVGTFTEPSGRFSDLAMDYIGPLHPVRGFQYVLTVIDRYTRYPYAIPVADQSADVLCQAFMTSVVAHIGVPEKLTTDRAKVFLSHKFQSLLTFLGVSHTKTSSYHPQSNGLSERFNKSLKVALSCAEEPAGWLDNLGFIMLSLRNIVKPEMGLSPANMTYGQDLRLPGQFVASEQESNDQISNKYQYDKYYVKLATLANTLKYKPPRYSTNKSFVDEKLKTCTHVFLRNKPIHKALEVTYNGPFRVLKRNAKNMTLEIAGNAANKMHNVVSIDRVKPANIINSFSQEQDVDNENLNVENALFPRNSDTFNDNMTSDNNNLHITDVTKTKSGRTITRPVRFT